MDRGMGLTQRTEGHLSGMDETLLAERERLVGLCAHLICDVDSAQDLAQETLLIAWRHQHDLRDPQRRRQWLSRIARNVCRMSRRSRSRDLAGIIGATPSQSPIAPSLVEQVADDFDLELELERDELAVLLDRAMAQLSPESRSVLIWRYIEDLPRAEVAARLGLTEGAVAMRLQRGKLALRRLLTTDFRPEAEAYGVVWPSSEVWQETRIWCPACGIHRLVVCVDRDQATVLFRCTGCCQEANDSILRAVMLEEVQHLKSYKAILARQMGWFHRYIRQALAAPEVPCPSCGAATKTELYRREEPLLPWGRYGLHIRCHSCQAMIHATLQGLVLDLPEAQQFWRQHPKLRMLPEVEVDGRSTLVTTLESLGDKARLDVVSASNTYQVMGVYRTPGD